MKLLCDACERLGEPSALRLEAGQVVATCGRCGASGSLGALAPIPLDALPPPPAASAGRTGAGGATVPTTVAGVPPVSAGSAVTGTGVAPAAASAAIPVAPVVSWVPMQPAPQATGPSATPAFDEDPYAVPGGRCPKCVAARPEAATHCALCGLAYAKFVAAEHRLKPGLDRAWRQLMQKWDDPAQHDKLLLRAQTEEALPQVARLYQLRIARHEGDVMAQRGREELLRRAMATATVTARPAGQKSPANRKAIWLGLLVGTVLMLALLFAVVSLQRSAG